MRTSYSKNNTYINCPQHYDWLYNKKFKPAKEGASLYFGSAIDASITALLNGDETWVKLFHAKWNKTQMNNKLVEVFDNNDIVYSNNDFDADVLLPEDRLTMENWIKELNIDNLSNEPIECFKEVLKIKKNPYKQTRSEQLRYFNRCSWLSLKRKGDILLTSFKEQFFPKIKKVLATQLAANIKDPYSGDSIQGFVDMVLEYEGYDKPIIFDLKTASQPYDEAQLETSEQLTLYAAMKGNEYNTDLVGYVVLCKNINKEKEAFCKKCNYIKNGSHRTCNSLIEGVRCNGEWDEKTVLNPKVQVLIEQKTPDKINMLLNDVSNIVLAMKHNIVYKNSSKCDNWYGNPCPYKKACWKNDTSDLKKND